MSNFGIGLGSFMSGFTQGAGAAQGIKRGQQQEKLADMQIKNLEDQQSATQGAKDLSMQGVKDATANTDGQAESVMNYYMTNTAPKLQQHWLANGEVDKANAFGKWIQDTNVQQGMKYGAGMMRSAQLGDADGVMNNMVNLYNQPGYFEDGQSAVNAQIRRDDKGNAAGMDITLRNDKTGKETTHTFNSMDEVYKLAQQFASPDQVFKFGMEQLQAGEKAQADAAKEKRDWERTLTTKEIDQGYKLEGQANASELRRAEEAEKARNGTGNRKITDAKATISFLKENGATDEYIKSNMAGILGIENRSRPVSSRIDDYIKMRTDSDRKFGKLSLDEQIKEAQSYIGAVDRQSGDAQGIGVPQSLMPTRTQGNSGQEAAGASVPENTVGMVEAGNIDLTKRPQVRNPDGSVSTVRSMSVNFDGKEVLIPTVVNGKVVSEKEAIDHYMKTGEHLGKFDTPEDADKYAQSLHEKQAKYYGAGDAGLGKGSMQQSSNGVPFLDTKTGQIIYR